MPGTGGLPDGEDRIDSILLKNRGMPRTVMVTEQSKNYQLSG